MRKYEFSDYQDELLNETNASYTLYSSLDYIFNSVGYTSLCDALYLSLITIVSLAGLILNILSLITLNDKDLPGIDLYKYLRVYVLHGIIVNFVYIFEFLSTSFRYISFASSYPAQVYYNHVSIPIATTGYFYGTILDICITLDRIGNFNKRVKGWIRLGPYKMCAIGFAVTLAVNFTPFFAYMPVPLLDPLSGVQVGWYCGLTEFATTQFGTVLIIVVFAFRDLLLLIVEIVLNFVSVYFLSRHIKKKAKIEKRSNYVTPTTGSTAQRPSVFQSSLQPTPLVAHFRSTIRRKSEAVSRADLNLTLMAVVMSVCSSPFSPTSPAT